MNAIRTLRKIIHPNFLPVAIYKEKYPSDEVSAYVLYGTSNDGEDYFSLPLVYGLRRTKRKTETIIKQLKEESK